MKNFFGLHTLLALAALIIIGTSADARQRGPVSKGANDTAKNPNAVADAHKEEVRIVYYSGDVALDDTITGKSVSFGMLIDADQQIVVGRGGSVQFAVDGKLADFNRAGRVKFSEIIRRATGETNEELMSALRAVAAQNTFMTGSSTSISRIQAAVVAAIDPSSRTGNASATGIVVPLEPRSSAVTRGPLRFRWLSSADAAVYRIVVRNRYDEEVLRHETSDTSFTWESAVLMIGSEYSWTIARVDDSSRAITSTFHRLDDLRGMRLEG
ncbi:MAG: hypothetical protein H7X80_02685, partial [bacterium]|nr:hypothetical protein [Candidatus Kapabacteria bacterium]